MVELELHKDELKIMMLLGEAEKAEVVMELRFLCCQFHGTDIRTGLTQPSELGT